MPKLVIDQPQKRISTTKIANAVYTVLNQSENLKAELIFYKANDMQKLNLSTRKVDKVTDVLSFPSLSGILGKVLKKEDYKDEVDGRYLFIGSIVLCEERVKEQAKELEHSVDEERTYLIVHGLMHLFGYDHEKEEDKVKMREMEKKALRLLGIKQ